MASEYWSIRSASSSATTGASSAVVALPNKADGTKARRVLVQTVAGSCYVLPSLSGGSVAAGGGFVVTTTPFAINVHGSTHLAHIQITGAQTLVITPLED